VQRQYRLREKRQFQQVRGEGRCWAHPLCVLCVAPNHLPYSRFGFSVSRRIGGAVVRNRVKRQLREIVRRRMAHIKPGYDVVLIARRPIVRATHEERVNAVETLLRRARLWMSEPMEEEVSC